MSISFIVLGAFQYSLSRVSKRLPFENGMSLKIRRHTNRYTCTRIYTHGERESEREREMYIYVYVYIHIHTWKYIGIYLSICRSVCIWTSLPLYLSICTHICTYLYMYVYIWLFVLRMTYFQDLKRQFCGMLPELNLRHKRVRCPKATRGCWSY